MKKICFEYGAMSSRYRLYAENKYTAYAAMCCHFNRSAHLIALYEPVDVVKDDLWLNPFGAISDRLDEIYGGQGEFDTYFDSHKELIREAYETIEQKEIDKNDKREGEALLYTATKVTERTKKEMINKAKEAFNKACGWLSTYPWYPEVLKQFIDALEEE